MKIGEIVFIVGIVIAIAAGIFASVAGNVWTPLAIVVLGLLVGFLNISEKEAHGFLISGIGLIATSLVGETLSVIPVIGLALSSMFRYIGVFVAPAVIVVAIKSIYGLAKD